MKKIIGAIVLLVLIGAVVFMNQRMIDKNQTNEKINKQSDVATVEELVTEDEDVTKEADLETVIVNSNPAGTMDEDLAASVSGEADVDTLNAQGSDSELEEVTVTNDAEGEVAGDVDPEPTSEPTPQSTPKAETTPKPTVEPTLESTPQATPTPLVEETDEGSVVVNVGAIEGKKITIKVGGIEQKVVNEAPENMRASYQKYYDINNSMVGWVTLPGTNIDYPVFQHDTNEYYLDHDMYGNASAEGSIALDYRSNPKYLANHTILFGHNMMAGTMFTKITRYTGSDFFYSHQTLQFNTLYEDMTWQLFSAYVVDGSDMEVMRYPLYDEALYQDYLDKAKQKSLYDASVSVSTSDQILTLVTCSYEWDNARMIVHFKRVD